MPAPIGELHVARPARSRSTTAEAAPGRRRHRPPRLTGSRPEPWPRGGVRRRRQVLEARHQVARHPCGGVRCIRRPWLGQDRLSFPRTPCGPRPRRSQLRVPHSHHRSGVPASDGAVLVAHQALRRAHHACYSPCDSRRRGETKVPGTDLRERTRPPSMGPLRSPCHRLHESMRTREEGRAAESGSRVQSSKRPRRPPSTRPTAERSAQASATALGTGPEPRPPAEARLPIRTGDTGVGEIQAWPSAGDQNRWENRGRQ
jgi:hypothetical protein